MKINCTCIHHKKSQDRKIQCTNCCIIKNYMSNHFQVTEFFLKISFSIYNCWDFLCSRTNQITTRFKLVSNVSVTIQWPSPVQSGCYSVGARAKEISHGYTQPHRTLQIYIILKFWRIHSMIVNWRRHIWFKDTELALYAFGPSPEVYAYICLSIIVERMCVYISS